MLRARAYVEMSFRNSEQEGSVSLRIDYIHGLRIKNLDHAVFDHWFKCDVCIRHVRNSLERQRKKLTLFEPLMVMLIFRQCERFFLAHTKNEDILRWMVAHSLNILSHGYLLHRPTNITVTESTRKLTHA